MLFQEELKNYRIILASQSPRRKMLLEGLDIEFECIVHNDIEEDFPAGLDKFEIPQLLAKHKSDHYTDLLNDLTIVITADTIVWLDGEVINKPANEDEAFQMLKKLSGKTHEVITGVCLRSAVNTRIFSDHSQVVFRELTDDEIRYYVHLYRPFDKAGAYGIQEWIGYIGIETITGSFYNVMGLPVQRLYEELRRFVATKNI